MWNYLKIWSFVDSYLTTADSNIFNTRYAFQIAFKIYSSHSQNIHFITEDIVSDKRLACSTCAARSFIHQLYDNKYIKYQAKDTDKRKKLIIPTERLISAFESDHALYKK